MCVYVYIYRIYTTNGVVVVMGHMIYYYFRTHKSLLMYKMKNVLTLKVSSIYT